MNERDFKIAVENSKTFADFELFKKDLVLKRRNLEHLYDLYGQASRLGLDYLKQNQNITRSDFALIQELCTQ